MKKVLFIATVVKIHINIFHTPYLKWFKENGYEVHVAAKNDYENPEECYIPYCDKHYDIPFERSPYHINNIKSFKMLKKLMTKNEYDIIHVHTPMGAALGRLAGRESRERGTTIIYTAHGFHFYKGAPLVNWLFYYPVEKWLSRYTDTLITINKEDYSRAKKFKKTNAAYVPGVGIDLEEIRSTKIDRDRKREELGIPKESFLMTSVGELSKRKNHEVVIRALGQVNNSDIHYIICGQGDLEEELKELTVSLNLEDQVHLLGFRRDIIEINMASDLFVFPSYQEGLPVALMEAMAAGLPVVASDIRGNEDLIDQNGGFLISPDNIKDWAKSIGRMYDETKENKYGMGIYNKEQVVKYELPNVIDKMASVYKQDIII